MSKHRADYWRPRVRRSRIVAAFLEPRDDELLDAVVSAAALVASADGCVQETERVQLRDFFEQEPLLSDFEPEEAASQFERCVGKSREPGGAWTMIKRLGRHRGSPTASLLVNIGEVVMVKDDGSYEHVAWVPSREESGKGALLGLDVD